MINNEEDEKDDDDDSGQVAERCERERHRLRSVCGSTLRTT